MLPIVRPSERSAAARLLCGSSPCGGTAGTTILLLIGLGLLVSVPEAGIRLAPGSRPGRSALPRAFPRAVLGCRPSRDDAVDVLDVQVYVGDRATVEAVLGQVQLRGAAPQPYIQRPAWPEGVLGFDFEPELDVPLAACPCVPAAAALGPAVRTRSPAPSSAGFSFLHLDHGAAPCCDVMVSVHFVTMPS